MKKQIAFIWAVVLALFLYSAPAQAGTTSFVLSAAESVGPSFLLGGGAQRMIIPSSATAHLPSMGSASSTSVTRKMIARVGNFRGIATVGTLALAGYIAWVDNHPSDFPISYALLHPYAGSSGGALPEGTIVQSSDGTHYKVGAFTGAYLQTGNGQSPDFLGSGVRQCAGYDSWYHQPKYCVPNGMVVYWFLLPWNGIYKYAHQPVELATPSEIAGYVPTPLTDSQFADRLGTTELSPDVVPEVDKYIQDNPEAVQTPSGLPSEVRDAENSLKPSSNVDTDGDGITDDVDPDIDGDGILNADDTDDDGDGIPDSDEVPPDPPSDEYEELNFQPLQDLGDDLADKFPFTLLATLKNFALGLVATPQAPSFDIDFPAPFNYTWHISLERFDNIARMVRVLIGMAFLSYVTMALLRRFH